MAVKMAMRKGGGEHGWIAGRQAGRIPLGGCWKAVAGLLDFAGMFRLLLRGFILNHLFFFYTIWSFFIPCQHSQFLLPRVVPPRGGNGNIVLSHNG